MRTDDLLTLPTDLPEPEDDGATDHLPGMAMPPIPLPSTAGGTVQLDDPSAPPTVVFAYPRTGRPGEDPPGGLEAWNAIPGARGCTPQACSYRDRHALFTELGARVFGLSTQDTEYQREAVERLHLPYALLSDERLALADALGLPRFVHAGLTLLRRQTLLIRGGRIDLVIYPVFPSDSDADRALAWVRDQRDPG
jgi:peroxiredoxin